VAQFIGGPCNGQTAPSGTYAQRECGGVVYTIGEDGNYHAPGSLPGFPGTSGPVVDARQVGKAFHRLMHVPAVEVPFAVRRSRAGRARLRRLAR
jgi:hypothetical protein